jgi:hypothetical protein
MLERSPCSAPCSVPETVTYNVQKVALIDSAFDPRYSPMASRRNDR